LNFYNTSPCGKEAEVWNWPLASIQFWDQESEWQGCPT
jgi:hypothetical protein